MRMRVKVKKSKLSSSWQDRVKGTVNICGYFVPFTEWDNFKSAILRYNSDKVIEAVHHFFGELAIFRNKKELPVHYAKPFSFDWVLI